MKVKEIEWIDSDAEEASVLVGTDKFEVVAFCHPCRLKVGQSLGAALLSFEEASVVVVPEESKETARKQSGSDEWSHHLIGVVKDVGNRLVDCGGILVELTMLPGDANVGDKIECYPTRLDIVE